MLVCSVDISDCRVSTFDSSVVTRVEKDELAVVNEPLIPTAVKLLISEAFAPNEPLISLAICAELVTTFATFAPKCSFENEPLISLAICAELVTTFATFEPKCSFENEPLISLAICAEELTTDPSASPSSDVNLDAKLLETVVNDPLTLAAVKVLIYEAFVPSEPLIVVLDAAPNVEFQTPVPIVPTDVIFV